MRNWKVKVKPPTFSNIKNFFLAIYRWYKRENYAEDQADWRSYEILEKSPECIESGTCIHCGCDFPEKLYEEDPCEKGCYPKWKSKEEWIQFKIDNYGTY